MRNLLSQYKFSLNYCIDIVHINDILKYDDIFTEFQTFFKNDLNQCDVNTIINLSHKKKREIKIIRTTSLFNIIRTIINQKKRSIYCMVEKLLHLSKYELTSNEESTPKVKKTRKIINERRNDEQSANKDILLNISIKYFIIINRRGVDFINEINFNQHTSQSFM